MLLINDLGRQTASLRPQIDDAIRRVLDRGWFVHGPELDAFETEFARYLAVSPVGPQHPLIPAPPVYCMGVGNGTDALELALKALGIGPGQRVATVAIAGMYATTAILHCGATPVYIDVVPGTTHMDLDALRRQRVDAVIATHLYGRMEPMPDVLNAAGAVPVIEDCAQAHGARLRNRAAGRWGAAAAFSFYPTKNLGAVGDGGAVVTDNPRVAEKVRGLRQYGWTARYASTVQRGRNSRLDEIQAAVLRTKLPHLERWNQRRREIAALYSEVVQRPATETDVVHLFTLRHPERDRLREALRARGIAAEIHYPTPDYRQPAVESALGPQPALPETERHCAETLTLPCFPEMTDEEVAETRRAVLESL